MRNVSIRFLAVLALLLTVGFTAALAEAPADAPAVVISAPAAFEVGMGQSPTLPAALVPDDGSFELKFVSSDSSICKIALSTGVFKPYAEGACTVKVYAVPTGKSVIAEVPASVDVAVTVTRDVLFARAVQTGEHTLSLIFTGRIKDIDLSLISVVDEEGTPLTIVSIRANRTWKDTVDVTVAETLEPGKTYYVVMGDRRISFVAKAASEVGSLPTPTPTPRRVTATPVPTSVPTMIPPVTAPSASEPAC